MSDRIPIAVLGATGVVGQRLVAMLESHPWFELAELAASDRSAGRSYGAVCRWQLETPLPDRAGSLTVRRPEDGFSSRLVLSALDAASAERIEPELAKAGHVVVSNASAHRMAPDVPLLVPEINWDQLQLLTEQRHRWPGSLVTNPNCVVAALGLVLAPLARNFGLESACITTLQSASGAGYPGVASLDLLGNVIPNIPNEADKIEAELPKIIGQGPRFSAMTTRVPVVDGHTAVVFVRLGTETDEDGIVAAWRSFRGRPQELELPSAPRSPVIVMDESDRPQPRKDLLRGGGMSAIVSRPRRCPVQDWKFVVLGHNTLRGAAGAALLNAEALVVLNRAHERLRRA